MAPDAGSINNSAQQQSLLRSSPSPPLSDPDSQSSSPSASDSGNDIQSLLSGGWTAKDWKTLYHIVITHGLKLALVPFFVFLSWEALRTEPAAVQRAIDGVVEYVRANSFVASIVAISLAQLAAVLLYFRPRSIYLVDFACFTPPEDMQITYEWFMDRSRKAGVFNEKSMDFQRKIILRSGLGERTALPPALHEIPPAPTTAKAQEEARLVMFSTISDLLKKTGVEAREVSCLVVNCSLFCPTPSLSAAVVNHFKMRPDIKSYNLGGMGCSASVIAVSLAQEVLKVGCSRARPHSKGAMLDRWACRACPCPPT